MTALRSAVEIAVGEDTRVKPHPVPPITDPMGRHWDQPSRFNIEIDATHALMSEATFKELHNYSCSMPSGVYPGKMWKCEVGAYDPRCKPEDRYWQLRWYGALEDSNHNPVTEEQAKGRRDIFCSNHYRRILIV